MPKARDVFSCRDPLKSPCLLIHQEGVPYEPKITTRKFEMLELENICIAPIAQRIMVVT